MASPVIQFKRGALSNLPGLRAGEPALTTDSYDLYVGIDSTTNNNKFVGSHRYWTKETSSKGSAVNLVEGTTNGTSYISLKSPDSLAGVTTYTFPATATDGYFLQSDADGNLSWQSVTASAVFENATLTGVTTISSVVIEGGSIDGTTIGLTTAAAASFTDLTAGITTVGSLSIGSTEVISSAFQLKNIASLDAVTIATIENAITVSPNTFDDIYVSGISTFAGDVNIGDSTADDINVTGRFVSDLIPSNNNSYDLGISGNAWRNANFAGVGTFATGVVADGIQIGISGANVIDTVSGNLTLNSAGGQTIIDDAVTIQNNLTVTGSVSIGGTTVVLTGEDVFIQNKDIVLGYTTSITPNDTTANHAGVAIASTEGSPLVSFTASGINTLPDTYKQMMWFKNGTLGFSTDAFAFNYGVAIGTTTMANGVRLAVGSGVTISDTAVSATNFYGAFSGNASTATYASTAGVSTSANTVDTTATSANADYYLTFVDTAAGQNGETLRVGSGVSFNPSTNKLSVGGNVQVGGNNIQAADGTTALTLVSATGDVTVAGDLKVGGNDILASNGNTNITLTSNTLTAFAGDIKVGGNDIQASDGTTAVTLSASTGNVAVAGDLKVGGNDIQASDGTTALTLSASTGNVAVAGDLKVGGNDIQASDGVTAITLSAVTGNVGISSDLTVSGNLYVNGTTTEVNTSSMLVEDRTIELGRVDGNAPSATTTWDLGVLFNYNNSGAKKSGVVWEQGDARFKFASQLTDGGGTDVDSPQITFTAFAPIEVGALWVNDCAGASQVISCTGTERFLGNITLDAGTF